MPNLLKNTIGPGQQLYINPYTYGGTQDPAAVLKDLGLAPDTPYTVGFNPDLNISQFKQDSRGLYMDPFTSAGKAQRYFPKEYFDPQTGAFIGPNPQSKDYQDSGSYFKTGQKWNPESGQYESDVKWDKVLGTAMAAGSLGMGLAGMAPSIVGTGGSTAANAGGSLGSGFLSNLSNLSMSNPLIQGGIKTASDLASGGKLGLGTLANFAGVGVPAGGWGAQLVNNPLAQKAINMGVNQGINLAQGGSITPAGLIGGFAGSGILGNKASNALGIGSQLMGSLGYGNQPLVRGLGPSSGQNQGGNNSATMTSGTGQTSGGTYTGGQYQGGQYPQTSPMNSSTQSGRMRGIGPSSLMQYNQNNPNLAEALAQGRQQAIGDQGFRLGYDVKGISDKYGNSTTSSMPSIGFNGQAGLGGALGFGSNPYNQRPTQPRQYWNPSTGQMGQM